MKVYRVTKLFRGDTVSIRSPWPLERFLEEQNGVKIKMSGVYMTLSKRLVKDRAFQSNKYPQLSKIDGKPYHLIDFKWRPDGDYRERIVKDMQPKIEKVIQNAFFKNYDLFVP